VTLMPIAKRGRVAKSTVSLVLGADPHAEERIDARIHGHPPPRWT
jgi:DNA-binding LacI/PurR family transcriptional regulator